MGKKQIAALVAALLAATGLFAYQVSRSSLPGPLDAYMTAMKKADPATAYRYTNLGSAPIPAGAASALTKEHFVAYFDKHPVAGFQNVNRSNAGAVDLVAVSTDGYHQTLRYDPSTKTVGLGIETLTLLPNAALPATRIDGVLTKVDSQSIPVSSFFFSSSELGYRVMAIEGPHHVVIDAGPATEKAEYDVAARGTPTYDSGNVKIALRLSKAGRDAAAKFLASRSTLPSCPSLTNYPVRKGTMKVAGAKLLAANAGNGSPVWRVQVDVVADATDNTPTFDFASAFAPLFEGFGQLACGLGNGLAAFGGGKPAPCPSAKPLPTPAPPLVTLHASFVVDVTAAAAKLDKSCPTALNITKK